MAENEGFITSHRWTTDNPCKTVIEHLLKFSLVEVKTLTDAVLLTPRIYRNW